VLKYGEKAKVEVPDVPPVPKPELFPDPLDPAPAFAVPELNLPLFHQLVVVDTETELNVNPAFAGLLLGVFVSCGVQAGSLTPDQT
jgi:hypothetical protein